MTMAEETDVTRLRRKRPLKRRLLAVAGAFAVVIATASPSFADPTLTVSATSGLSTGQTLTISGSGFAANLKSIAIGQCVVGYTGPADCNTSGGAQFKNADASGSVASFTIVVKEKFGSHDCTKEQCLIAGAPLPTGNTAEVVKANTFEVPIYFGDAGPKTETPAAPQTQPAAPVATPVATTMATGALATTTTATVVGPVTPAGSNGAVGFLLLGAGALIAGGVGIMLIMQPRRGRPGGAA
jgi:hypothetical protein